MPISQTDFFLFNRKSQNQLINEFGTIMKKGVVKKYKIILAFCEKFYVVGIKSKEENSGYIFLPVKSVLHWHILIDRLNKNLLN